MARGPLRVTRAGRIPYATPAFGTLDFVSRLLPGGKQWFIDYARLARDTDPRVDKVVTTWDQLSRYKQNLVSLEELCAAVGLVPGEFFAIAARACFECNGGVTMLLAAMAYPQIMEAAVTRACTPQGIRERRIFFEWTGFLPSWCRVVTVRMSERTAAWPSLRKPAPVDRRSTTAAETVAPGPANSGDATSPIGSSPSSASLVPPVPPREEPELF